MILNSPTVRIVGRQTVDYDGMDEFITENVGEKGAGQTRYVWETDTESGAEQLLEMSGRLCYMSYGKGRKTNKEYIDNILDMKHGSVLEHCVWNFIISGVSRSFTHELVRHRAGWGYSQLSQRYVDESKANFIVPKAIQDNEEALKIWDYTNKQSQSAYSLIVDILSKDAEGIDNAKIKEIRGAARSVLPNATETIIFCTANARAIRHFIEMRASPYSDGEIRVVAIQLLRLMKEEAPNIFDDYTIVKIGDGSEIAITEKTKV